MRTVRHRDPLRGKTVKDGWIRVGTIGVDSALVFIGDPAYLRLDDHPLTRSKIDWRKLMGKKYPTLRQLGHHGVLTSTGWGDGLYEVEARIVSKTIGRGKNSSTTRRVAEIRVVFIEDAPVTKKRRRKRIA